MMRFWIYDDEGKLFRKFAFKVEAQNFLLPGWKLVIQPKPQPSKPTIEEFGEAPF
jgi:hypothetical protein